MVDAVKKLAEEITHASFQDKAMAEQDKGEAFEVPYVHRAREARRMTG